MNRRSFLGALGVFSILPGAGRVWRAMRPAPKLIPFWTLTQRNLRIVDTSYAGSFYDFLLKQYGPFPPSVPTDIPVNRPSPAELQRIFFS